MNMKLPFYLNEVLTGRFRKAGIIIAAIVTLAAVVMIGRAFSGYIGSIGHSYHRADDMGDDAP